MAKTIQQKRKEWQEKKEKLENEYSLAEQKKKFFQTHKRIKWPSTSKLLITFLFITCTLIMLFTGHVTLKSMELAQKIVLPPDFTPLVTLIGAAVSEVLGFAVYSLKAMKQNTKGGLVYEQKMKQLEQEPENDDGSVG